MVTREGRVLAAGKSGSDAFAEDCRSILAAAADSLEPRDELLRIDLRHARGSTVVLPAGRDVVLAVRTTTRTPESLSLELSLAAAAVRRCVD